MPIFYNQKAIFIRIPKTASTSISDAISENSEGAIHEKIISVKDRMPEKVYNDFFKFSFVRNPWDWLLSWAYYRIGIEDSYNTSLIRRRKAWQEFDFNGWIEGIGRVAESRGGTFWTPGIEFAHQASKAISCGLPTCRSRLGFSCICLSRKAQYEFICDGNGDNMMDFTGRFENLKEDWKLISSKLGINNKLKHNNKTNHPHYKKIYTNKTSEIIYNLYKKDINMFGYKF